MIILNKYNSRVTMARPKLEEREHLDQCESLKIEWTPLWPKVKRASTLEPVICANYPA
jgi:hypothetical protein